jgi:hypothetical protein
VLGARALRISFCLGSRHKLDSFTNHIAALNFDAAYSEQAGNMFFHNIYTRYNCLQHEAIDELNQLPPQLEIYLTVEFYRLLSHLAELQLQGVPTLGHTTTAFAESANSLVKRCFGDRLLRAMISRRGSLSPSCTGH